MNSKGIIQAKERLDQAENFLDEILSLPSNKKGFEPVWYSFLVHFNNVFSKLEQAAKTSRRGRDWYLKVKAHRRQDAMLRYLQHARNCEEHNTIGTIHRTKRLAVARGAKSGKKLRVAYRRSDGTRNIGPHVTMNQSDGAVNIKFIGEGIRFRDVLDRRQVYKFPRDYSHPHIGELRKEGKFEGRGVSSRFLISLSIQIHYLERVIEEAKNIADETNNQSHLLTDDN